MPHPTLPRIGERALLLALLVPLAVACGTPETTAPTVPERPAGVTGTAGDSSATVTWTASADGGSAITSYTVTSSPGGRTAQVNGATLSAVIAELTNGTAYTFTVTATNGVGTSLASAPSNEVTPQGAPGAPTSVEATPGDAAATVSWTAPVADGGSPVTGYTVTSSPQGASAQVDGDTLEATVTGLANGTAYTFTVTATNAIGTSVASAPSSPVTPRTMPDAPTAVTAVRGDAEATVSWVAPAFDGGSAITGYTVTSSPETDTVTVDGATLTATVEGLSNGTAYTFTVIATNVAGDGSASAASEPVTPATVPAAPTNVTATPADAAVTVAWEAPEWNGGSAVTGYTVVASPGSVEVAADADARAAVVAGLVLGTSYTFTVVAKNDVGAGPASAASNAVVLVAAPGAPTQVTAARGDAQATVSWQAPASDGGTPLTGYLVTASPGGDTRTTDAQTLQVTFTALLNGTAYTFTVQATNEVGAGDSSEPSNAVIPATTPGVPQEVIATRATGEATVVWQAPASDGGRPVTGYRVTSSPGAHTAQVDGATFSATVTGLTNGTSYTFTVTATNEVGDGDASAPSNAVVPATVPDAPTELVVEEGYGEVTVAWQAPAFDGYSAITGYEVTSTPGAGVVAVDGATLSAVVEGLTNGTPYTFTVRALNDIGPSEASEASERAVPGPTAGRSTITAVASVPPNGLADGADVVTVTLTARSTSGRALANVPVRLESDEDTDVLSVEEGVTDDNGELVSLLTATTAGIRYVSAELGSPATALIGVNATFTAPPSWVSAGGGTGLDAASDLALDASGNAYVVGRVNGSATFGTHAVAGSGTDVLVAKLSPTGSWLWAARAGGAANDEATSVALDAQGNVYVTGLFAETATFGAAQLTSTGPSDVFVAKLSPQGDWLWVEKVGGEAVEWPTDLEVDGEGNVYLTGYFQTQVSFGATTLDAAGSGDVFVAKLSPTRQWLWAEAAGGTGNDRGARLALDGAGSVFVGGHFSGEADFGSTRLSATGSFNAFVAKLSTDGAWLRAVGAPGLGAASAASVGGLAVDAQGACYLSGAFAEGIAFGSTSFDPGGGSDIFVARLTPAGDWDWAVRAGGLSTDGGGRVVLARDGDLRVTGLFGGVATFNEEIHRADSGTGVFVARLSRAGDWHWVVSADAGYHTPATGLAVDPHGHARVGGAFNTTLSTSTFSVDGSGSVDVFAATVSPSGEWYSQP